MTSASYITEPPTNGKVILKTTAGDIEIELWSKETPKACRNFVQLCLSGYYDGCSFHRVSKGFLIQTGDPTGTGHGGESIYGKPFPTEIHSRLKFIRRGLVAMACDQPNQNNSQFFITLDRCDWLNGKHTIFGKVVGNTIFNVLRIADMSTVDGQERPIDPCYLTTVQVIANPFDDLVLPATTTTPSSKNNIPDKSQVVQQRLQQVAKRKSNLLSFDEETESFPEQKNLVHFSVIPTAIEHEPVKITHVSNRPRKYQTQDDRNNEESVRQEETTIKQSSSEESEKEEMPKDTSKSNIQNEYEQLKWKWKQQKTSQVFLQSQQKDEETIAQEAPFMSPVEALRLKYATKRRNARTGNRQEETLKKLKQFQANLRNSNKDKWKKTHLDKDNNNQQQTQEVEVEKDWLVHRLQFPETKQVDHSDDYQVFDPLQDKRGNVFK
eukprot:jgi/Galph1/3962/GphlegSOOS_G2614.1